MSRLSTKQLAEFNSFQSCYLLAFVLGTGTSFSTPIRSQTSINMQSCYLLAFVLGFASYRLFILYRFEPPIHLRNPLRLSVYLVRIFLLSFDSLFALFDLSGRSRLSFLGWTHNRRRWRWGRWGWTGGRRLIFRIFFVFINICLFMIHNVAVSSYRVSVSILRLESYTVQRERLMIIYLTRTSQQLLIVVVSVVITVLCVDSLS